MKRRFKKTTKRNQAGSGSARFSFAKLEPKQLLAGNLSAAPFVGPVLSTTVVEIVEVDCPQKDSKSHEESNCGVLAGRFQYQECGRC